jgi:hypothetical protein
MFSVDCILARMPVTTTEGVVPAIAGRAAALLRLGNAERGAGTGHGQADQTALSWRLKTFS